MNHLTFLEYTSFQLDDIPNYFDTQKYREFCVALHSVIPDQKYRTYLLSFPLDYYINDKQHIFQWIYKMYQYSHLPHLPSMLNKHEFYEYIGKICLSYPINPSFQESLNYYEFFQSLRYVIPDKHDRNQYLIFIQQYPLRIYLKSQYQLVEWFDSMMRFCGIHH